MFKIVVVCLTINKTLYYPKKSSNKEINVMIENKKHTKFWKSLIVGLSVVFSLSLFCFVGCKPNDQSNDDGNSPSTALCGLFDHETGEQTKTWEQLLTDRIIVVSAEDSTFIVTTSHNDLLKGDLVLPDNIKKLDDWSFQNCSSLTGISLPASIKSIGNTAF